MSDDREILNIIRDGIDNMIIDTSSIVGNDPACMICGGRGEVPATRFSPPHMCDCDQERAEAKIYELLIELIREKDKGVEG